ncbi:MAG: acetyl esterase/lipase [Yoonia sp.]|jgi:arylformamidase
MMEFDDAYAIAAHIPGSEVYPDAWTQSAAAFRAVTRCEIDVPYGETPRQKMDVFYPSHTAKGFVVFVHGGYWLGFDKSFWSHLAAGPLSHGWAVAVPSYELCPDVNISEIGRQVAKAIAFTADRVAGPIRLVGHSAGGHLVTRVVALPDATGWQKRVQKIVAISPVADLAPLMQTAMNCDLKLTKAEALRESPVHQPAPNLPVTVWVGADERPVFIVQAHALARAWDCKIVVAPDRHHFDVIEGMADQSSGLLDEIML